MDGQSEGRRETYSVYRFRIYYSPQPAQGNGNYRRSRLEKYVGQCCVNDRSSLSLCCVPGGVRAIISKGWSARMNKQADEPEVEIPPECYQLDKVPHE